MPHLDVLGKNLDVLGKNLDVLGKNLDVLGNNLDFSLTHLMCSWTEVVHHSKKRYQTALHCYEMRSHSAFSKNPSNLMKH